MSFLLYGIAVRNASRGEDIRLRRNPSRFCDTAAKLAIPYPPVSALCAGRETRPLQIYSMLAGDVGAVAHNGPGRCRHRPLQILPHVGRYRRGGPLCPPTVTCFRGWRMHTQKDPHSVECGSFYTYLTSMRPWTGSADSASPADRRPARGRR